MFGAPCINERPNTNVTIVCGQIYFWKGKTSFVDVFGYCCNPVFRESSALVLFLWRLWTYLHMPRELLGCIKGI